jgi:DNA-binding GntR family transcriptional regulator
LAEAELAAVFGVSRTKVRTALARLAQDGLVELRRNQGASVLQPTEEQTRHVFALRAMVEPAVVADLAHAPRRATLAELRRHIRLEHAARRQGQDTELIRLTGVFHLLLAKQAGNPLTLRLLRELEVMTCLAILRFAPFASAACPCNEHAMLVEAIARGEPEQAAAVMRTHLDHVLQGLNFRQQQPSLLALLDLSSVSH